jgi:hypothetical protein
MDVQTFWSTIDAATANHRLTSERADHIIRTWQQVPMLELVVVDYLLQRQLRRARLRPLRTVCYLINGANDRDTFSAFRGWLLLQGQAAFDAAIEDPDSIADLLSSTAEQRPLLCPRGPLLARLAHKRSVGHHVPHVWSPITDGTGTLAPDMRYDDDLAARFPRLMAVLKAV